MVRLSRIYTRSGDSGVTRFADGQRVPKHAPRIAAYGTVDETNAVVGMARLHTAGEADAMLARIQNDLFDLGADLATPGEDFDTDESLRVTQEQVDRLEQEIDRMNEELEPLRSFVLPGGCEAATYLHLARTVARRAEREICTLADAESVNPAALRYINRLSDHFFVMSRHLNDKGAADVLWVPGGNR
ncbi:MAG: cob(I)yrinic acid a,c-diamide adenosyltransferase [Sphingomonadales bacterium]